MLRLQKARRKEPQCANNKRVLSNDECLLWKDMLEHVAACSKEIAGQLYMLHVMSPLLGSEHVNAGVCSHRFHNIITTTIWFMFKFSS